MEYLIATLLVLLNTLWLVLVAIGLPGNWLMVLGATIVAAAQWSAAGPDAAIAGQMFHPVTLIVGLILCGLGEVAEFAFGAVGTRKAGGSRLGAAAAILGGIAGGIAGTFLIPIPIAGSLLGACIGAGIGALGGELMRGETVIGSLRSGKGAAMGRLWGTAAKLAIGVALWIGLGVAAFWP